MPTLLARLASIPTIALVVAVAGPAGPAGLPRHADGALVAAAAPAPGAQAGAVAASPRAASIRLHRIASGLSAPVFVTAAHDGSGRLFIVEKTGAIRIWKDGAVRPTPFLDISGSVSKGSEQGLLGLAFHPRFRSNGRFFVDFTNRDGDTVVREYRVSAAHPNRVDTATGRTILRIDQPFANHNGGMLGFGPDGFLYISTGDGGGAGDPGDRAQNRRSLLGKILRIDVDHRTSAHPYRSPASNPYVGRPGRNEIWQLGLRNPWRFSFDDPTGRIWIGDVGQNRYEEVDRAKAGARGAGVNWGWRVMEGFACFSPSSGCDTSGKRRPILTYSHASNGRCAITGGYVYRGARVPALRGGYLYGDYCSGEIFVVPAGVSSPSHGTRLLDTALQISSFGLDGRGELYVCDLRGNVYRIVAA